MKKLICSIVFCILSLSIVIFFVTNMDAQGSDNRKSNSSKEKIESFNYNSKTAKKTRTIKNKKQKISLTYYETRMQDKEVAEIDIDNDNFGVCDIYRNPEGNMEYMYIPKSDKVVCFRYLNINDMEPESLIDEEKAIKIATDYMLEVLGDNNDYNYFTCYYSEFGSYYDVCFVKKVGSFMTDDTARIWVNTEGKVLAYIAFLQDRYDDITIDKKEQKQTIQETNETLDEEYNISSQEIIEQYITYDKDGLILKTTAATSDSEIDIEIDIPVEYKED